MDLLTVALIVIGLWIAVVIVAVAFARAAGRADADDERLADEAEQRAAAERAAAERAAAERAAQRSPLDVLADDVLRTTEKIGQAQPPVGVHWPRAVRFRERVTGTQQRIRKMLH
jgi:hypothetical protein